MKKDTNFESAKKYISLKRHEGSESLCGPGSHYENAKEMIDFLDSIIDKYEVKSILDLGCGDWNWFQHINLRNSNYIGWDCDHKMIEQNNLKYGSKKVSFEVKDIVTNKYPKCDLIICRDVLFHLKIELSLKIISNIKKSCNYFLSTSFKSAGNNTDIKSYCKIDNWGFYNINLHKEPFMLSEFECDSVFEKKASPPKNPRYACLFDFSKIKNDG